MSKFQKLKHFHFYLWILAHGFNETTPTRSEVATNEPSTSSGVNRSQTAESAGAHPHVLPSASFPWVTAVTQLELGGRGPGWLCYNDIMRHMPLSLCGILMAILISGKVSSCGG